MLRTTALAAAWLAAVAALAACQSLGAPQTAPASSPSNGLPGSLQSIHDPRQVTGTITGPCHSRKDGQLPDSHCTPGAVDPAVTQQDIDQTICMSGYTATVRPPESQTERAKFDVAYPAYGIPDSTRSELDHLVPLELGGANDLANLWPEVGSIPNAKDRVENVLHRAVCDRKVRLAGAQQAIAANWTTAEAQLGIG